MIRDFLTDILWEKIQIIMKKINVIDGKMIAMLYLLYYVYYIQALLGEIFSLSFSLGKQLIIDLIDGHIKTYGIIFF